MSIYVLVTVFHVGIWKPLYKFSFAYIKIHISEPEACLFRKYVLYPA